MSEPDPDTGSEKRLQAEDAGGDVSDATSDTESSAPSGQADPAPQGTGFWRVVQSVLAGLIGVQSSKNKERDFTHGKPIHFIIGGVVGTFLFLIAIWLFVQYLIATS